MSDRSNTQLLKDTYGAFGRGDFAPLFSFRGDNAAGSAVYGGASLRGPNLFGLILENVLDWSHVAR